MAREAYRSLYGDLTKLKDNSLLNDPARGTGDDTELFQLLLAASEWVDRYCNRHFMPMTRTLDFDGSGDERLIVPDLLAVTTLKADEKDDKAFETTWTATDYWLEPYNAQPDKPWGQPYTSIRRRKNGARPEFLDGEQNYEIAGRWGYREYKEGSGSNINDAGGISASDTTVGVTSGSDFAIGQSILIENEQMLITNIVSNNLTVVRALNGTNAASHADALDVFILRPPLAVERATLITAARLWTRAPWFEPFYVDADVRLLLESYIRFPV
jgi:hypothetical protein